MRRARANPNYDADATGEHDADLSDIEEGPNETLAKASEARETIAKLIASDKLCLSLTLEKDRYL